MHLKQLGRISRSDEPDQYALFTRLAIIKSVNVAGFRLCDQFTTTLCQKIMVNQPICVTTKSVFDFFNAA